jgi:hypothetical protein
MCGRCSGTYSLGRRGLSQPVCWRAVQPRALLWTLIDRSARAQPALWCRARQLRALLWPLFSRSEWAHPATAVAGTTCHFAALSSVRLYGVGPASHYGGGNDGRGRCSGLCLLGWRVLSQPLWWRKRQVKALLWPLFAWSAWAQPATLVAVTTGEGAALASVVFVAVGTASHCVGGQDM